jgi:hypothetical protein
MGQLARSCGPSRARDGRAPPAAASAALADEPVAVERASEAGGRGGKPTEAELLMNCWGGACCGAGLGRAPNA